MSPSEIPEHCFLCLSWDGYCKRAFQMHIILGEGHGSCKVDVMPGTVPEHLVEKLQYQLQTILSEFMDSVITKMEIWKEIQEWQKAGGKERENCAAREARKEVDCLVRAHLKLVPRP